MTGHPFADAVKKAISQSLSVADLLGCVDALTKAGEKQLVSELYRIWLQHNTSNPLAYAVYFNFGVILSDAGDLPSAKEALSASKELNPGFIPAYINLGNIFERMGDVPQAVATWTKASERLEAVTGESASLKTTALKQIGRVFETAKLEADAEATLRRSLDINPRQRDVMQHWIALRQSQCKWPLFDNAAGLDRHDLMEAISPLSIAVLSNDPLFQLANAHNYNKRDVGRAARTRTAREWNRDLEPDRRLRVGYVSSDLREHAVGFLMSEVFELHNRTEVEIFAYYCGIPSTDLTNTRFKASTDHWRDISSLNDADAASLIEQDEIDILVDLNGYTKDARLKVFARRPAPVIVNWLGFPGTMGSTYHNYIIADPFIVPPGQEAMATERVLRLPCYQPNDRKRKVAPTPTRADAGLPEDCIVFCCFNGTQKINRLMFETWLAILAKVDKSVLWLLSGTTDTNERLQAAAAEFGIEKDRLVFAPRKNNPEHLARYALADIFLDTFPYGAHTTASDALWMGVPVITTPGRTFASRVCGSLVKSAGLGELICDDFQLYVEKAVELATTPEKLIAVRNKLASNRDRCVLFDTALLVRSLEQLYREMWGDFIKGQLPVPDLSNLEVIHEIGCDLDHEATQSDLRSDLRKLYRERFVERHAICAVEADRRLSPAAACARKSQSRSEGHRNNAGHLRGECNALPGSDEISLQ